MAATLGRRGTSGLLGSLALVNRNYWAWVIARQPLEWGSIKSTRELWWMGGIDMGAPVPVSLAQA